MFCITPVIIHRLRFTLRGKNAIRFMLPAFLTLSISVVYPTLSLAQDVHSVHKNDKIRLTYALPKEPLPENPTLKQRIRYNNTEDFAQTIGNFIRSDQGSIFIRTKSNVEPLGYSLALLLKIEKSAPKPKKYLKTMLIGFSVGTVIGAVVFALGTAGNADDVAWVASPSESVIGGMIIGGIPGFITGSLIATIPRSRWIEIPIASFKR